MNLPPDPRYLPPGGLHWSRDLFLASLFLTTGTTVLALAAIAFLASMNLLIFLLGGAMVEILHLLAWLYLRVASHADAAANRAFRVSILLFLNGLFLLPVSLPQGLGAYVLVFSTLWPYAPSVYAGVVACHGLLFLRLADKREAPRAVDRLRGGGILLLVLALPALATQLLLFLNFGLLFLPAIYLIAVSFAYALVLAGAWHEYQLHMSIRTWTRAQP